MKVLTVVGARPQFIKAAVVSNKLRKKHKEILVHTGQHYDYNMSEQFFEELDIPTPDYNLGISGGSHAYMTGNMMIALEKVMISEKPDCVLVYGDTNSTLAAALTAAKLHIPIIHVEAGLRTHSVTNPEEMNRICTDHLSTKLLVCTESGMAECRREGLADKAVLIGDPMYDAFQFYSGKINLQDVILTELSGRKISVPQDFYYLTCHREENTQNESDLKEILMAMNSLDSLTVYPVHPRNKERIKKLRIGSAFENIIFCEPVGYLESICLVNHAKKIVTDSGGLQREAFFAKKKCISVLDFVVWQETMVDGRNMLAKADRVDICNKLHLEQTIKEDYCPFGDGHSAEKIIIEIENLCKGDTHCV